MMYSQSNPWIAEREATLCTWKVDYNRGYISNMNTSLFADFMSYSNRQIAEYVKMIKACGFTGIQVTDMCSAWRPAGSWESVHDKYKVLADELHKNGMKFTVWCWAAEFSEHGWHDKKAFYEAEDGVDPYDDPRVFATFNRYYDIYADLAPYADRVIAHFFDPGRLTHIPSILKFAKLLFDKFRAKKPDIKLAIDTWSCPENFPRELVDAGFPDVMLMELPRSANRAQFRQGVKNLGCELGSWGWYTCEYETDQLPLMCVNNRVLKDVYSQTREQGDEVLVPSYWSEMDAYHIINVFSLYAAGHLLTDPDSDPDTLLYESAVGIAGEESAKDLLYVLELIRDARSGDTWNSYWWTTPEYILNADIDREAILKRAEIAEQLLLKLSKDETPHNTIPLPFNPDVLYRLMIPHVLQIAQFARFSMDFKELTALKDRGASKEDLQEKVNQVRHKVLEYNCVIGLFGQPEARNAFLKMKDFCLENGLTPPDNRTYHYVLKRRMYDRLTVAQRGSSEQVFVEPIYYEAGFPVGLDTAAVLLDELVAEGVLVQRESDGQYALAEWENQTVDFNI